MRHMSHSSNLHTRPTSWKALANSTGREACFVADSPHDHVERVKALAETVLASVKDVKSHEIPHVIMACLDVALRLAMKEPNGGQVSVITGIDRLKNTLDSIRAAELMNEKSAKPLVVLS